MKSRLRMISFLAALLLALTFASGCAGGEGAVTTAPDVTAAPPAAETVQLVSGGETDYKIIYSLDADKLQAAPALRLSDTVAEATGADMEFIDDYVERGEEIPPDAREIIVGFSNRPLPAELQEEPLRDHEWAVIREGERIFLLGSDVYATDEAVGFFTGNYLDASAGTLAVPEDLCHISRYTFPITSADVGGVSLFDYTAVYDADDPLAKASAEYLRDYLRLLSGETIALSPDTEPETEHEFRIGDTGRGTLPDAPEGEYLLYLSGDDIVACGDGLMTAGAVGSFITAYLAPHASSAGDAPAGVAVEIALPSEPRSAEFEYLPAKNVILCIGDGMGYLLGDYATDKGYIEYFIPSLYPNFCRCTTESLSGITDSAASGTALATGTKVVNGTLALDADGRKIKNVREYALDRGCRTAVLTTDEITGATPSAFTVHIDSREKTNDIIKRQERIEIDYMKGSLINTLTQSAAEALALISSGDSGFFMMVEEAYTDFCAHEHDIAGAGDAMARFNGALAYITAFVMAHPDTALIVTADHDNGDMIKGEDGVYSYSVEGHSTRPVGVWALGAGTGIFGGDTVDNTDIARFMIETVSK